MILRNTQLTSAIAVLTCFTSVLDVTAGETRSVQLSMNREQSWNWAGSGMDISVSGKRLGSLSNGASKSFRFETSDDVITAVANVTNVAGTTIGTSNEVSFRIVDTGEFVGSVIRDGKTGRPILTIYRKVEIETPSKPAHIVVSDVNLGPPEIDYKVSTCRVFNLSPGDSIAAQVYRSEEDWLTISQLSGHNLSAGIKADGELSAIIAGIKTEISAQLEHKYDISEAYQRKQLRSVSMIVNFSGNNGPNRAAYFKDTIRRGTAEVVIRGTRLTLPVRVVVGLDVELGDAAELKDSGKPAEYPYKKSSTSVDGIDILATSAERKQIEPMDSRHDLSNAPRQIVEQARSRQDVPAKYWTKDSDVRLVYKLQGRPSRTRITPSGEIWYYGDVDCVLFDRESKAVAGWFNSSGGLLARVDVETASSARSAYLKRGTTMADVVRTLGQPQFVHGNTWGFGKSSTSSGLDKVHFSSTGIVEEMDTRIENKRAVNAAAFKERGVQMVRK